MPRATQFVAHPTAESGMLPTNIGFDYTVLAVEQLDMIGRRSNKTALLAIACREQRTYPPASPTISLTWLRFYQQQLDRRSCTYAKPCSI